MAFSVSKVMFFELPVFLRTYTDQSLQSAGLGEILVFFFLFSFGIIAEASV